MKTTSLLFVLLFCFCLFSNAQFTQIAAGPEFDEPHSEYSKFLLMKNGNLVFAEVGFKDSILIRVYNKAHQEIAVTSYAMTSTAHREYLNLTEAFEINGDAVLFISRTEEKAEVLYRVIVDQTSGQIKKEEKISELKTLPKKEQYAMNGGGYNVSKGNNNDNYAIAYCNNFQSEKIKKIEVILFSKEHVEINRASYETTEKEFNYMRLRSMIVTDPEKVVLLVVGNPWQNGQGKMFSALMKRGSSTLSINMLDFDGDKGDPANSQMNYDSYSNKIVVVTTLGLYYLVDHYVCLLNPETAKPEKIMKFKFTDAIFEKGKDLHGRRYTFYGKPVKLLPGKNGAFSVVFEENDYVSSSGPGGATSTLGTIYTANFTLDIVVADFDKNGNLVSNFLIPKKYLINSAPGFGNPYRTFAYIKSNDKGYIFINDNRENIELLEKNKNPKQVSFINNSDAFYFSLTGNLAIPPRKYLYRKTSETEKHIQSPFGVFAYDKENDLFITLRLNRDEEKKTKTVNVVWLKPQ
jgi:hypothetical protein